MGDRAVDAVPPPGARDGTGVGRPTLKALAPWFAVVGGWAVAVASSGLPASAADNAAARLVLACVMAWWVAVVVVIRSDLRAFVIPDGASLAIAALGLAVAAGVPALAGEAASDVGLSAVAALASGAVAFGLFWLVGSGFARSGRDALGFGDVKLAGASAIWLAPGDAALALEIAALGAMLALLVSRRVGPLRDTPVPFGAFLAPAAWAVFVLGPIARDAASLPW